MTQDQRRLDVPCAGVLLVMLWRRCGPVPPRYRPSRLSGAIRAGDRDRSLPERAPASDRGSTTREYALRTARGWDELMMCCLDLRPGPIRPAVSRPVGLVQPWRCL